MEISTLYLNKVVSNLLNLDGKFYNFLEPDTSLWNYSLRGITSRIRSSNLDRLKNLFPSIKEQIQKNKFKKFRVIEAKRTGLGTNPHNEVVSIKIIKNQ